MFLPKMHRPMTQATPPRSESDLPPTYEAALQELEQLVGRLESGELPLEELMGGYQRGAALLQFCRDKLAMVENQIKVVEAGALKPWTAE
jgi:exodeoxyribonuclease VII small subunit